MLVNEPLRDIAQLHVPGRRSPDEVCEGGIVVDAVPLHEDAERLPNDLAASQCLVEACDLTGGAQSDSGVRGEQSCGRNRFGFSFVRQRGSPASGFHDGEPTSALGV